MKVICFSILIAAILFSNAIAGPDMDFQVPVPGTSQLLDTKDFYMSGRQIKARLYKSRLDKPSAIRYYEDVLASQGFVKTSDDTDKKSGAKMMKYKKEELVINVSVIPQPDGTTQLMLANYLQPRGTPELGKAKPSFKDSIFALPKQDMPGKDLGFVSRPPNSVRWASIDTGKQRTLMYSTSLSVADAAQFYKERLSSWTIENETATRDALKDYKEATGKNPAQIPRFFSDGEDFNSVVEDSCNLDFRNGQEKLSVTIFPNFTDRKLGSIVSITYNEAQ